MTRRGFTLVEALTSIFVLAIGLLALTVFIIAGVMQVNRTIRSAAAQQSLENFASLSRVLGPNLPQPALNSFAWVYQPAKSPPIPPAVPFNGTNTPYSPADAKLGLTLDIQGPYQQISTYANPTTGQVDLRPFLTGHRLNPTDPERYTAALAVRPVPTANPDQTLVDVSVVVFEDFDGSASPYVLNNASLRASQFTLTATNPAQPIFPSPPPRAILLDGDNGYVYRWASGELVPAARANSSTVIVLPQAVEALELGIISRR
ncbi:hypothetical protein HRbin36_01337 [bacterium HR36]|nr:hypothetical protein HRbin36_01337 [bacterium HR36]